MRLLFSLITAFALCSVVLHLPYQEKLKDHCGEQIISKEGQYFYFKNKTNQVLVAVPAFDSVEWNSYNQGDIVKCK